ARSRYRAVVRRRPLQHRPDARGIRTRARAGAAGRPRAPYARTVCRRDPARTLAATCADTAEAGASGQSAGLTTSSESRFARRLRPIVLVPALGNLGAAIQVNEFLVARKLRDCC